MKLLDEIQSGAPEYLTRDEDIAYFFDVVNQMKDAYGEWNPPPLILEYSEGSIRVNDGRHRLEMYRQLGISKAWAVCWMTKREKYGGIKMIEVCLHCGNGTWNKYIEEQTRVCPICGSKWDFLKFPLFFITGASGVGKTTAARILQRKTQDFMVMDADMFYNIMPHDTEE